MGRVYPFNRVEGRIPMEVAVNISGHKEMPGVETAFTENVSARGARVVSARRWRQNDLLTIASLPGGFRATARVAYCQTLHGSGYAIGLEFLEPIGDWVVDSRPV